MIFLFMFGYGGSEPRFGTIVDEDKRKRRSNLTSRWGPIERKRKWGITFRPEPPEIRKSSFVDVFLFLSVVLGIEQKILDNSFFCIILHL